MTHVNVYCYEYVNKMLILDKINAKMYRGEQINEHSGGFYETVHKVLRMFCSCDDYVVYDGISR